MAKMIKAWVFNHEGFPSALRQTTLPVKPSVAPTEIRVRVKAAAINPVDIQLMNLPIWRYLPRFLAFPEHGVAEDFSGIVEEAGETSGFARGQEIFGMVNILSTGCLQEVIQIDTNTAAIAPKPPTWSWEQAAALPLVTLTARTTFDAIHNYVIHRKTPKVVVLGGSSATGMYCVYLAAARGWTVAASCSDRNAEFVRSMGASQIIDYTSTSVPEAVKEFQPDAIIDCVGGTECIGLAYRYVTIVGDKTSRSSMGGAATYLWNPQMVWRSFLGLTNIATSYVCVNLKPKSKYLEETLTLPPEKIVIDSTFAMGEVREAFARLNTGRARGKIVITVPE